MAYQHIQVPADGEKITVNADNSLNIPNNPIIPFIEGDGIGVDITPVMIDVVDAAVEKAYGGERKIAWMEIYSELDKVSNVLLEALTHSLKVKEDYFKNMIHNGSSLFVNLHYHQMFLFSQYVDLLLLH